MTAGQCVVGRSLGAMAIAVVLLLAGTTGARGEQPRAVAPDAIYRGGKVVTVDPAFTIRQAFAVKGDRFVAVGGDQEVLALAGPQTRIVDLRGRTVIPGLADNHNHMYRAATAVRGVATSGVTSLPELLERVRQAVNAAKPGATVYMAAGWQPVDFPEKRLPTRRELDEVSAGHPVLLSRGRSQIVLNTAALSAAGIGRETTSIAGVVVPKDAAGEPTGVLNEPGPVTEVTRKLVPPPSDAGIAEIMLRLQREQHELGLTSIRELALSPEAMRLYGDLRRKGLLTLRVSMGLDVQAAEADRLDDILKPWGVGPAFGDEWLRLDSVAEFSVDSGTDAAFVRVPLEGQHEHPTGVSRIGADTLRQAMLVIHRFGWRPAIHIMGDKALDLVLDAYEAADRVSPIRPRRWVVEHVPLVQPDQMARIAKLGVLVSAQIQPNTDGRNMLRDWGTTRANHAVPMRELLANHVAVSSGTDWPSRTNNPFVTLGFYVTRQTLEAGRLGVDQRISREEALRLATTGNAYLTFEEGAKGSIEAGKLADFLVLSEDVLAVPEDQIARVRPVATFVGGRPVFQAPGTSW